MNDRITVARLFDTLKDKLQLEWVAGRKGATHELRRPRSHKPAASLAGYLNFIHPTRLQIIGSTELRYLRSLTERSRRDLLKQLFTASVAAVFIADKRKCDADTRELAESGAIPLLRSDMNSQDLLAQLQYYLTNLLAERTTLHGVFMEVMGIGVLIVGASSVGKSELALELINRGHRLIADDAPEFARIAPDIISGECPEALRGYMEVRGLGLLDIRAMFGEIAIKSSKYLRLIVNLEPMSASRLQQMDRLEGDRREREVLGMQVPEITLPVTPGRNLAVLLETAVRHHILTLKGYDPGRDFTDRQRQLMERDERT